MDSVVGSQNIHPPGDARIGRKKRFDEAPMRAQRQQPAQRQDARPQRADAGKSIVENDRPPAKRSCQDIEANPAQAIAKHSMFAGVAATDNRHPGLEPRRIDCIGVIQRSRSRLDFNDAWIQFRAPDELGPRGHNLGAFRESVAPICGLPPRPVQSALPRSRRHAILRKCYRGVAIPTSDPRDRSSQDRDRHRRLANRRAAMWPCPEPLPDKPNHA